MRWIEISVSATPENTKEIAAILGRYGQGGAAVEERESGDEKSIIIKAYISSGRSVNNIKQEIEQSLSHLPGSVSIAERSLDPEDWFSPLKEHFHTIEIGEKLVIKPEWIASPLPLSDRTVIELDPGAAFGTGLHPTTRLCLVRIEKHIRPGMSVFDLGTGTGILSIAAAKLGAASVMSLDIDPVAVKVARRNSVVNAVDKHIRVNRGTLSAGVQRMHRDRFDMALANITARAICGVAERLIKVLKPGGILIASGINAQGLDEVLICLAVAGFNLEAIDQADEWYAVAACRP
jgi:ribosomal protein L11 methyltransferase